MAETRRLNHRSGFSVLELLVALTVLGILAGISFTGLVNFRASSAATAFLQTLAQDINTTRSLTMVSGSEHRIVFVDAHTYRIDRLDGTTWTPTRTASHGQVELSGAGVGDYLLFSTKGFVTSHTSRDVKRSTPINAIQAEYGNAQRVVRITLIGLARVV